MALRLVGSNAKGKARALLPGMHDAQYYPRRLGSMANAASASTSASPSSVPSSSATPQAVELVESTQSAVSLLRSQPTHYVVASIVGRTVLLHARDVVTLPRINDVQVGDVVELDRIHEVGSRDYTLRAQDSMSTRSKGPVALMRRSVDSHQSHLVEMLTKHASDSPILQEVLNANGNVKESQSWGAKLRPGGLAHIGAILGKDVVRVRCTVIEHTMGPMELIVKKKRRKGYKRTIRHKQTYTRLRVEGIQLAD